MTNITIATILMIISIILIIIFYLYDCKQKSILLYDDITFVGNIIFNNLVYDKIIYYDRQDLYFKDKFDRLYCLRKSTFQESISSGGDYITFIIFKRSVQLDHEHHIIHDYTLRDKSIVIPVERVGLIIHPEKEYIQNQLEKLRLFFKLENQYYSYIKQKRHGVIDADNSEKPITEREVISKSLTVFANDAYEQ